MRGTWFYDSSWTPLEETVADEAEKEHLIKFKGEKIEDSLAEPGTKLTGESYVFVSREQVGSNVEINTAEL